MMMLYLICYIHNNDWKVFQLTLIKVTLQIMINCMAFVAIEWSLWQLYGLLWQLYGLCGNRMVFVAIVWPLWQLIEQPDAF